MEKSKTFFVGQIFTDFILQNKNRLVTDSSITANTFNIYLINITNTLNLKPIYEDPFSVLKIKEKYKTK